MRRKQNGKFNPTSIYRMKNSRTQNNNRTKDNIKTTKEKIKGRSTCHRSVI